MRTTGEAGLHGIEERRRFTNAVEMRGAMPVDKRRCAGSPKICRHEFQCPSCLPHLHPFSSPFPSLNCALIGQLAGIPAWGARFPARASFPVPQFPARFFLSFSSIFRSRLDFPPAPLNSSSAPLDFPCDARVWRPPCPPRCHRQRISTPRRRLALEADAIDVLARRRGRLGPLVRPTPSR